MDLKELAEACDWPLNQGFQFLDDPDEHKPCYVVLPGGAMLPLSHHGKNGVDQARARFIVDACNAALGNTVPLLISQEWLDRKVASEADAECEACTPPAIRGKPMSETKRPDANALAEELKRDRLIQNGVVQISEGLYYRILAALAPAADDAETVERVARAIAPRIFFEMDCQTLEQAANWGRQSTKDQAFMRLVALDAIRALGSQP